MIKHAKGLIVAYAEALAQEAQRLIAPLKEIFASLPPEQKAAVIAQDPASENMLEDDDNSFLLQQQYFKNMR